MSDSIVHGSSGKGKPSRAQIRALLRRAGTPIGERRKASEPAAPKEVATAVFDPLDDRLADLLGPAQISSYYRRRIDLFEPAPVPGPGRNEPITAPRLWRAAADAGRRSRRSDKRQRPPESGAPSSDDRI